MLCNYLEHVVHAMSATLMAKRENVCTAQQAERERQEIERKREAAKAANAYKAVCVCDAFVHRNHALH